MRRRYLSFIIISSLLSCGRKDAVKISSTKVEERKDSSLLYNGTENLTRIATGTTTPAQLVSFADSLKGIPYKYGSTDPKQGFDCSGFITYVFNHFGIKVPRQSVDFTPVEREIDLKDARTGDLILFTGTDSTIRVVGHMGILVKKPDSGLNFLHSTSGKDKGVTETPLNTYYMGRYVKTIRIFENH